MPTKCEEMLFLLIVKLAFSALSQVLAIYVHCLALNTL